jgi:hypothetical protein
VVNFYFLGVGIYDEMAHEIRAEGVRRAGRSPPDSKTRAGRSLHSVGVPASTALDNSLLRPGDSVPGDSRATQEPRDSFHMHASLDDSAPAPGGFVVGSRETDAYSREEVSFLSLVANQVALAVDGALNFEASESAQVELRQKQAELWRQRDQLQLLADRNSSEPPGSLSTPIVSCTIYRSQPTLNPPREEPVFSVYLLDHCFCQ